MSYTEATFDTHVSMVLDGRRRDDSRALAFLSLLEGVKATPSLRDKLRGKVPLILQEAFREPMPLALALQVPLYLTEVDDETWSPYVPKIAKAFYQGRDGLLPNSIQKIERMLRRLDTSSSESPRTPREGRSRTPPSRKSSQRSSRKSRR